MSKEKISFTVAYPDGVVETVKGSPDAIAKYKLLVSKQKASAAATGTPATQSKEEKPESKTLKESLAIQGSLFAENGKPAKNDKAPRVIQISENRKHPRFSGKHSVYCVTNGKVYKTQKDAEEALNLVRWSIKNSFLRGDNKVKEFEFISLKKRPQLSA